MMKTTLVILAILTAVTFTEAKSELMTSPDSGRAMKQAEADGRFEEALALYLGTCRSLAPDMGLGELCRVNVETRCDGRVCGNAAPTRALEGQE